MASLNAAIKVALTTFPANHPSCLATTSHHNCAMKPIRPCIAVVASLMLIVDREPCQWPLRKLLCTSC